MDLILVILFSLIPVPFMIYMVVHLIRDIKDTENINKEIINIKSRIRRLKNVDTNR